MRRIIVLTLAVGAIAYAPATAAGPPKAPKPKPRGTLCVLHAKLLPGNEVRTAPVTDPVESRATGIAKIKVRRNGTVEFRFRIKNPAREEFRVGHIHAGAAGTNGPPVAFLFSGPPTTAKKIRAHGTTTFIAGSNVTGADLCANPSAFYVNFHTREDPQGAIRGQLGHRGHGR
ncbi:MAG: CHRD domain-containing protein [Actinomycetota bacterium]|nr:CHRD domain-containing protein [Actinomycetota bacterium]